MKLKTKWLILMILSVLITFSGCQSVLIPEDKPLVLDKNSWFSKDTQDDLEILSYEDIGNGTVQDISYDGSTLLILNPTQTAPVSYNIDLLRYTDQDVRLTSFLSSEKKELSASFDPYAQGIFYVDETVGNNGSPSSRELIWTSIDKSNTKTISSQEENVNPSFCTISDSRVLYTNNNRNIIFADSSGLRQSYQTTYNLDILQIAYLPDANSVIYTAISPDDENKTNLYRSDIKDDETTLTSTLIDENVIDFDLNSNSGILYYIKTDGGNRKILRCNTNNYTQPSVVAEGNFTSVTSTEESEKILFSEYSTTNSKSSRSIWIMDSDGNNKFQLSAPMTLTSKIIAHPYKSTIYFSAEKGPGSGLSSNNGGPKSNVSTIYKIDYNIK